MNSYVLIVVTSGDGTEYHGRRVTSIRFNTKTAAENAASVFKNIAHVFIIEDFENEEH